MESLLSGLIGALIATILSVAYSYLTEQSRLRTSVTLEAVAYFDDIYNILQALHVEKDATYTGKNFRLSGEEYRTMSETLKDLLFTRRIYVKLAIIYDYEDFTNTYQYLKDACLQSSRLLWNSTADNWLVNSKQIHNIFENKIDPTRIDFENSLLEHTRIHLIIKDLIKRNLPTFSKVFDKTKPMNKK